jgi:hypothetical protein
VKIDALGYKIFQLFIGKGLKQDFVVVIHLSKSLRRDPFY